MFDGAPEGTGGVTLLARQPASPLAPRNRAPAAWPVLYEHLVGRYGQLRAWRWPYWGTWSRLAEYILPERFQWFVTANRMDKGHLLNDQIIDSTATLAMQTCAAGMWSGLTNRAQPWFELQLGVPGHPVDDDAKHWLADTQDKLYTVFEQSNFYDVIAQGFKDLSIFCTAPVGIFEDVRDVVRFYLYAPGEYYLGLGSRLEVDTLYTERVYTVLQLVDRFGLEACPPEVQLRWQEKGGALDRELAVITATEPNFAISSPGNPGGVTLVPGHFPYRQVSWIRGQQTDRPLEAKGFNLKPFIAMLWSTVANEPYGRGPGWWAIGDIKQLQIETREKAEFIKKLTKPPMGADVALKNEPASIWPGHINYFNSQGGEKKFWPLFEVQPAGLAPLVQDIEKISQRIKDCFYVDVFMAITQMQGVQPRNELELTKRDQERLAALGPVVNLVTKQFDGMMSRVLDISDRRGILAPLPPSMRGVPLKVQYNSMMRVAQKASQAVGVKDFLATAGELSSAAKAAAVPDPIRTVKLDKLLAKFGDFSGIDPDLFFTAQEVAEHDAAREKAQAQAQAGPAAMAAVTAAKTLSQTPTGQGTALSALLGSPQGAGA